MTRGSRCRRPTRRADGCSTCPRLDAAAVDALQAVISGVAQAVVYSWQPALVAQRLDDPRITCQPIPAFLVDRFGARASAATGGGR